jgi:hypothetical protein
MKIIHCLSVGTALSAFLLAGCSSGGGGGSTAPVVAVVPTPTPVVAVAPTPTPVVAVAPTPTPTAFTNWQSKPSSGVLRLSGSTVEGTYNRAYGDYPAVASYNITATGIVSVDNTYTSGTQTAVAVNGSLSSVHFTTGDGSTKINISASPNTTKYSSPSGLTSLLIVDAPSAGYSYMSYGAWAGTGHISGFHAGTVTAPGSVPTSGSTTYTGTSSGYYTAVNSAEVRAVTSDVTLTANYATRSISYAALNTQGAVQYPTLNLTGTLTYNAGSGDFSGTLNTPQNYSTGNLSGTATGSFYGPAGQEVAGKFVLSTAVGAFTGPTAQYIGSFGGRRP